MDGIPIVDSADKVCTSGRGEGIRGVGREHLVMEPRVGALGVVQEVLPGPEGPLLDEV